jgi:hypothetical protein
MFNPILADPVRMGCFVRIIVEEEEGGDATVVVVVVDGRIMVTEDFEDENDEVEGMT